MTFLVNKQHLQFQPQPKKELKFQIPELRHRLRFQISKYPKKQAPKHPLGKACPLQRKLIKQSWFLTNWIRLNEAPKIHLLAKLGQMYHLHLPKQPQRPMPQHSQQPPLEGVRGKRQQPVKHHLQKNVQNPVLRQRRLPKQPMPQHSHQPFLDEVRGKRQPLKHHLQEGDVQNPIPR